MSKKFVFRPPKAKSATDLDGNSTTPDLSSTTAKKEEEKPDWLKYFEAKHEKRNADNKVTISTHFSKFACPGLVLIPPKH